MIYFTPSHEQLESPHRSDLRKLFMDILNLLKDLTWSLFTLFDDLNLLTLPCNLFHDS